MIEVIRYTATYKVVWNDFNAYAKNGIFLFNRDYMEYHQDRFCDHSLLFYKDQNLVALLPLNEENGSAYSHAGLTFGGLIVNARIDIYSYAHIFDALINYLKANQFKKFIYKPIPHIFQKSLALEDSYFLYLHQAKIISKSLSSCIELTGKFKYTKGRKWSLNQARKADLHLKESQNYTSFMQLVKNILQVKYSVKPTHTAEELTYLSNLFPDQIKLLVVYKDLEIIGGVVIYIHAQVVHLQYIGLTEAGKKLHALDLIMDHLIRTYASDKKCINFGISPGDDAYGLNTGLIQNKESYGARSLPQDIYEINL